MTVNEVLKELEALGNPATKNTLMKHGAREPFFGVRVGDMKKLLKKIKNNHSLALSLYDTGNTDAMYLAGLACVPSEMDQKTLNQWADQAYWYMLSEYTVAWVAAESSHGWELAQQWIQSEEERIASCGWATLSSMLLIIPNEELDLQWMKNTVTEFPSKIHQCQNRVKHAMNNFVIALGSSVPELTAFCKEIGQKIGKVEVYMGETSCKTPLIVPYIEKVEKMGRIGKKKKQARC